MKIDKHFDKMKEVFIQSCESMAKKKIGKKESEI